MNNPPRDFTDDYGKEKVFGLLAVSENTEYQEEVLLYPPSMSENIIQSTTIMSRKLICSLKISVKCILTVLLFHCVSCNTLLQRN